MKAKAFLPADPGSFAKTSAVILFLSSRHPAGKRRTPNLSSRERVERASSEISGKKRRKGGSKENKEEGRKRNEDRERTQRETARARVRLRMTKTGCQDPERLPDGKRRSFKQKLLSATIEFILLSKEGTGNVC